MKRLVTAFVALLLLVVGCSSSGSKGGKTSAPPNDTGAASTPAGAAKLSGKITVYAASSLTEAFNTIKADFIKANPGTDITFNFGSSGDLSTSINQGAPADVFASAAPKNMASVVSAGNATTSTNFVSNTLEIATPPKNPAKISAVSDLAKSGVKVALCVSTAPCGAVAAAVFKNAKITVKPTASEPDVKSTLAAVESGEVDAGAVYVTDVKGAGAKVHGVAVPDNINSSTEYPIAALKNAKNAALAQAFVAYVLSAPGQQVLTAAGFKKP